MLRPPVFTSFTFTPWKHSAQRGMSLIVWHDSSARIWQGEAFLQPFQIRIAGIARHRLLDELQMAIYGHEPLDHAQRVFLQFFQPSFASTRTGLSGRDAAEGGEIFVVARIADLELDDGVLRRFPRFFQR